MRRVLLYRHIASAAEPPTKDRNISRKGRKGKNVLSFRPKGEIFLRSLASTRDDGLGPSLGILGVLARELF